MQNKSH